MGTSTDDWANTFLPDRCGDCELTFSDKHYRLMGTAIAASAVLLTIATPALAVDRQFVCRGQATGARSEKVTASIYLTPGGKRVAVSADWDPPLVDMNPSTFPNSLDLMATFLFPDPGPHGIGPIGDGLIMVMAFVPPGKRKSDPKRQLAKLTLEVTFDGRAPQTAALSVNPALDDLPMTAFRSADLPPLVPGTRRVHLRLHDRRHRQVALTVYDLSDPASRDQLFATAWSAAEAAARNPVGCELTA